MSECTICNVCDTPGTYEQATEVLPVPCNVKEFKDDIFTVWRCRNCGSLHCKEEADLGSYYARYPFRLHQMDFHTRIGYRNRLTRLQAAGLTPEHSILDFGCGKGLFVDFLIEHGYPNAFGYDPFSEKFASSAPLNRNFDFVVSYDVIEHVPDPRAFVSKMCSLSARNGTIVLGCPNAAEIPIRRGDEHIVELCQPYHQHILSETAMRGLVRKAGLDVLDFTNRFYFDSWIPAANTRFMWTYVAMKGNFIDVCVEPPDWNFVLRSPKLMFYALFGYLFRIPGNMLFVLKNRGAATVPIEESETKLSVTSPLSAAS